MERAQEGAVFSWLKVIRDASLSGFPAMLATHCECRNFSPDDVRLDLEAHESMKTYMKSKSADELLLNLRAVLGADLEICWTTGKALNAPAIRARTKRSDRFISAVESVRSDKFMEVMSSDLNGRVVVQSIVYD